MFQDLLHASQHSTALSHLLPISRLGCLATSSFSPLLSFIITASAHDTKNVLDQSLIIECQRTLNLSIYAAIMSTRQIPELVALSTLGETMYDIRGAMRGPGGEDHVGCISLKRLATESDDLAYAMLVLPPSDAFSPASDISCPILSYLCHTHEELKQIELSRGPGVHHGTGVVPKSRRVLLGTISRLTLLALEERNNNRPVVYPERLRENLVSLFCRPIEIILQSSCSTKTTAAERYFRICESVFDLAHFSPSVASSLFSEESHQQNPLFQEGARCIVDHTLSGYNLIASVSDVPNGDCIQVSSASSSRSVFIEVCVFLTANQSFFLF